MWGGHLYVMSKNTLKYKVRKQQSNMWTEKYNVKLGYKKVKCAVNGKGYQKVKCRWNAIFFVNYAAIQHNFGSTKNILQCGFAKLCFGWVQVNEVQNSTEGRWCLKKRQFSIQFGKGTLKAELHHFWTISGALEIASKTSTRMCIVQLIRCVKLSVRWKAVFAQFCCQLLKIPT